MGKTFVVGLGAESAEKGVWLPYSTSTVGTAQYGLQRHEAFWAKPLHPLAQAKSIRLVRHVLTTVLGTKNFPVTL